MPSEFFSNAIPCSPCFLFHSIGHICSCSSQLFSRFIAFYIRTLLSLIFSPPVSRSISEDSLMVSTCLWVGSKESTLMYVFMCVWNSAVVGLNHASAQRKPTNALVSPLSPFTPPSNNHHPSCRMNCPTW